MTDSTAGSVAVCLDCGAPVTGRFCQYCGQRHEPPIQPLRHFIAEAGADVINLDSRLYRTLARLVRHPGALTRDYLAGRRTRYLAPFRLYLGISLGYFIIFTATGSSRFFIFWIAEAQGDLAAFVRLLPKLMFALLPLFAALLALLYHRAHRLFTEHLVFALHFHAFAFLVLPIVSLLQPMLRRRALTGELDVPGIAGATLSFAVELAVVAYLFLALRTVYGGRPFTTALKTLALFLGYMTGLALIGALSIPSLRQQLFNALQ